MKELNVVLASYSMGDDESESAKCHATTWNNTADYSTREMASITGTILHNKANMAPMKQSLPLTASAFMG